MWRWIEIVKVDPLLDVLKDIVNKAKDVELAKSIIILLAWVEASFKGFVYEFVE